MGKGEDGKDMHYKGQLGSWLNRQRQGKECIGGRTLSSKREAKLQQLVNQGIATAVFTKNSVAPLLSSNFQSTGFYSYMFR